LINRTEKSIRTDATAQASVHPQCVTPRRSIAPPALPFFHALFDVYMQSIRQTRILRVAGAGAHLLNSIFVAIHKLVSPRELRK
jgi:hypothetical protein